jgi:hypothetical protein
MKSNSGRSFFSGACELLGVIALVLGVLLGYATRSIFNSEAFSKRVAASLSEPGVSAYVAGKLADGVVAAKPDLTGVRPIIIAGARTLVVSAPFRVAARRAALEAHRALMSGTVEKLMLSVQDVGEILKATLAMHPEMAAKLPRKLSARLVTLEDLPAGELAARLVRAAFRARVSSLLLMFGGVGLLIAGVWLAPDRRRVVFRAGVTVAIASCLLWAIARFGGYALGTIPRDPDMGALVSGLWRAFFGDLRLWALGLGIVGVVFSSVSASLLERTDVQKRARAVWRWLVTTPSTRGRQFLHGLAVVALGTCAVAWPAPVLSLLALLAGVVVTFFGLRECFAAALMTVHTLEAGREKAARPAAEGGWSPARLAIASVLVTALVGGVTYWVLRSPSGPTEDAAITACNGYPELCDRRLDEVAFATSHNSMGGGDNPGWLFPNQNKSIPKQLEDGVRAFLIDVHYGMPVEDKVKTIMENEAAAMAKYEAVLGKEGMAAALRIRDRLVGGDEKEKAVYMAHGFCELGAVKFEETLEQMHDFLVENPGEILIIVVQDEGVSPQDVAKCFEESGMIDFVYRGPAKPPWPTLREMAESGQRVLVMAENNTAGVEWYHPTLGLMQETPYTFHDPSEFSEKPNRGGRTGSLLLMNHWIESTPMPKPSNAEIVNSYDFLLKRAKRCQKVRKHIPNLVAVDFYATGDLVRVVQTLNRVKSQ